VETRGSRVARRVFDFRIQYRARDRITVRTRVRIRGRRRLSGSLWNSEHSSLLTERINETNGPRAQKYTYARNHFCPFCFVEFPGFNAQQRSSSSLTFVNHRAKAFSTSSSLPARFLLRYHWPVIRFRFPVDFSASYRVNFDTRSIYKLLVIAGSFEAGRPYFLSTYNFSLELKSQRFLVLTQKTLTDQMKTR